MAAFMLEIDEHCLEALRHWKNENKKCFFCQKHITQEEQWAWFEGYKQRDNDLMFIIVDARGYAMGCLGIRLIDKVKWDVYNVICDKRFHGKGIMYKALAELILIAKRLYHVPITAEILASNKKALAWYKKNGFVVLQYCKDKTIPYYVLQYKELLI